MSGRFAAQGRILVVEDEALVRMLAVDQLGDLGFCTEEAASAADALNAIAADAAGSIQAAIIDMGLPDRRGDAVIAEIRALRPMLPIIIATGTSEADVRDCLQGDRHLRFLGKPYDGQNLQSALEGLGIAIPQQK